MKKLLLLPTVLLSACATMGGSKGSVAPAPGPDVVEKRRNEVSEAAKAAMDCMKVKAGEQPGKGGVFAAEADANGKLTITPITWDGPEPMKQCIVDAGNKTTVSALPGPSVGTMWEFVAPGEKSEPSKAPADFGEKMQSLTETMNSAAVDCEQRFLGPDFAATVEVTYYVYNNGKAYAPTIVSSDVKDGGFEACLQQIVRETKFPVVAAAKPFPTTFRFKVGLYGSTKHE
jgi:hypothetical protein